MSPSGRHKCLNTMFNNQKQSSNYSFICLRGICTVKSTARNSPLLVLVILELFLMSLYLKLRGQKHFIYLFFQGRDPDTNRIWLTVPSKRMKAFPIADYRIKHNEIALGQQDMDNRRLVCRLIINCLLFYLRIFWIRGLMVGRNLC